jgi:S1-C subfamily serine protease
MAQCDLGLMYYKGDGIGKDYIESYKWLLLAAMNGSKDAQRLKEFLHTKMTSAQMEESQQRVNRIKKIKGFLAEKEKDSKDRQIAESTEPGRKKDSKNNKHSAENAQSTSTGFLITSDGFILTACHSVEKAAKAEVLHGQKRYSAKVIYKDDSTDFAVLKIDGNDFSYLPLASSAAVKTGDAVFTMGYPQVNLQGTEPKFTEGSISSLSGSADNPSYFQVSVPVQPGNSGGPLVNEKGQVVGLIVAKLSDVTALLITGSVPQNVNYALKSSFILPLIESIPDLSKKISDSNSVKDKFEVIEKTKKSVVLIIKYE